jgi:aspartyl-tRNA(Asn)/glutamyl-tRNA(Gln) amidotransferase subunit A
MNDTTTVRSVRDAFRARTRSATEICRDTLARIERFDPRLHAFNTIVAERALARAAAIDRNFDRWRDRPLAAVPVALKDNLCTRGLRTTASSRMLEHFVPPYDATVVARLETAGAIIVGKTNCDEFAMGSSNENSAFGAAHNPWALDRTPGGSSGGSAAAVAAGMAPLALGSDTGGSVRQPACLCGVVGLKPTYGRVSRYGLIAFGSSLDQIGPLTRSVGDAAAVLGVIAGEDPADATTAPEPVPDYASTLEQGGGDIRGARIGVPRSLLEQGVDPEIRGAVAAALQVLQARGATLVDVDLPHARHAIAVYYLVATAEASSNLARYDGVRYGYRATNAELRTMYSKTRAQGFGPEVKRRIMLGTYVLSAGYYDAYYLKAQQVRTLILRDYEQAFSGQHPVDVIAMPTSPTAAFRLGERLSDPLQMYLADIFTVSANLAGLPAISVPCGFTADRLPIGLQLTGRRFDETTLLRVADAYERDTEWWTQLPPIATS